MFNSAFRIIADLTSGVYYDLKITIKKFRELMSAWAETSAESTGLLRNGGKTHTTKVLPASLGFRQGRIETEFS